MELEDSVKIVLMQGHSEFSNRDFKRAARLAMEKLLTGNHTVLDTMVENEPETGDNLAYPEKITEKLFEQCLMLMFAVLVKHDFPSEHYHAVLESFRWSEENVEYVEKLIETNMQKVKKLLTDVAECGPRLTDVKWRLVYLFKNSVADTRGPQYLLTFKTTQNGETREKKILCSPAELADILLNFNLMHEELNRRKY